MQPHLKVAERKMFSEANYWLNIWELGGRRKEEGRKQMGDWGKFGKNTATNGAGGGVCNSQQLGRILREVLGKWPWLPILNPRVQLRQRHDDSMSISTSPLLDSSTSTFNSSIAACNPGNRKYVVARVHLKLRCRCGWSQNLNLNNKLAAGASGGDVCLFVRVRLEVEKLFVALALSDC